MPEVRGKNAVKQEADGGADRWRGGGGLGFDKAALKCVQGIPKVAHLPTTAGGYGDRGEGVVP